MPRVGGNEKVSVRLLLWEKFIYWSLFFPRLFRGWLPVTSPHPRPTPSGDAKYETMTSRGPSVWVKISSSWICIALYVWTLVAPLVLVNRDFD